MGNGRFPLPRSRFKTFSFLCTLFAMSQSPEETTPTSNREIIELIALFAIGTAVIWIMIIYDTRQLTGCAIWWYAHRKQPKEPAEHVSSV